MRSGSSVDLSPSGRCITGNGDVLSRLEKYPPPGAAPSRRARGRDRKDSASDLPLNLVKVEE